MEFKTAVRLVELDRAIAKAIGRFERRRAMTLDLHGQLDQVPAHAELLVAFVGFTALRQEQR